MDISPQGKKAMSTLTRCPIYIGMRLQKVTRLLDLYLSMQQTVVTNLIENILNTTIDHQILSG